MDYIYLLKNNKTKRIYVGRTCKPKNRLKNHLNNLRANRHTNELLQKDYNQYGECSFEFEVVESIENLTRTSVERDWMIKLKTYDPKYGYNFNAPIFFHRTGKRTKNYPKVAKYLVATVEELIKD